MTTSPSFKVGVYGTPGDYRAYMFPNRPDTYTFRFAGTIHGRSIDEKFTSSKTTFSDIEDPVTVAFPAKDPSVGQLSDKVVAVQARPIPKPRYSRGLAVTGIALGAIALAVGIVGLTRKRAVAK